MTPCLCFHKQVVENTHCCFIVSINKLLKTPIAVSLFPYQSDDHSGHERPEPAAVVNSKSNANMAFARFNKQPLEASPSSSPSSNMAFDSWRLLDPKVSDDGELFLAVQDSSIGDLVTD